ncbi:MAG: RluA family pseudouridine synthase [Aquabacterium sp.]|uniref:RluA family pseudouridine synthase n=1 Tax=Aquabacterium sp. TaxID=1872578 RepID=UPI0011FCC686|nr:RluA family pseudouridine synthase [Aquabacterium sp.]TAK93208.1 MAG: RluA family pseudouridine synthase [Aquabacterium sp.]
MRPLSGSGLPSATPDVIYSPPPDEGLDVIYHDEAMVVVNKPSGLLSVPGRGDGREDCMVSRVMLDFSDALIVHRLDMATSGLLVLARGEDMQRRLSMLFQDRRVSKRYVALVHGLMSQDAGEVNLPLITDWPHRPKQMVCHERGKPSLTRFSVDSRDAQLWQTRVSLEPVTGRSHQLRVHMLASGHPIVGDPLYGDEALQSAWPRLMLHASEITLPHPVTGVDLALRCPVPF